MTCDLHTLRDIVAMLDPLDRAAQWTRIKALAAAGHLAILSPARGTMDPGTWTIDGHGAIATGASQAEVLRNWIRVATTMTRGPLDADDRATWAAATINAPRSMAADLSEAIALALADPARHHVTTITRARALKAALAAAP